MKIICKILGSFGLTLLFITLIYFFSWEEGTSEYAADYGFGPVEMFFMIFGSWTPVLIASLILGYMLGGKIYEAFTGTQPIENVNNSAVPKKNITSVRVVFGILGMATVFVLGLVLTGGLIFFALPVLVFLCFLGYFLGAKMGEWTFVDK